MQTVQADKQRITSEYGGTLIRRIAVTSRSKRQDLPHALACLLKQFGKAYRLRTQVTDTVWSW